MSELNAEQQKALEYRDNMFRMLAGMQLQLMQTAVSWTDVVTLDSHKRGAKAIRILAAPGDFTTLIQSYQTRLQQLEIGLAAIVDMLLQSKLSVMVPAKPTAEQLVKCTRDPELPDGAQPFIKAAGFDLAPSQILPEQFWVMCGKAAERQLETLRRAVLSGGTASPPSPIAS